jgi:hypothetical protein
MTSAHLARRIKAIDTRSFVPPFLARMPSGISRTIPFPNCGLRRNAPAPVRGVAPAPSWATAVVAAFLVTAGALALEFLVLWVASGRVIERLPF